MRMYVVELRHTVRSIHTQICYAHTLYFACGICPVRAHRGRIVFATGTYDAHTHCTLSMRAARASVHVRLTYVRLTFRTVRASPARRIWLIHTHSDFLSGKFHAYAFNNCMLWPPPPPHTQILQDICCCRFNFLLVHVHVVYTVHSCSHVHIQFTITILHLPGSSEHGTFGLNCSLEFLPTSGILPLGSREICSWYALHM